jgi:hypothetical protein
LDERLTKLSGTVDSVVPRVVVLEEKNDIPLPKKSRGRGKKGDKDSKNIDSE